MCSDEITEAELMRLGHDMVAAGNLNQLYGIDPFMRAKASFETAVKKFATQVQTKRPVETSTAKFSTDVPLNIIPEILKNDMGV